MYVILVFFNCMEKNHVQVLSLCTLYNFIYLIFSVSFLRLLLNPFLCILPLCCGNDVLLRLCFDHEIPWYGPRFLNEFHVIGGRVLIWNILFHSFNKKNTFLSIRNNPRNSKINIINLSIQNISHFNRHTLLHWQPCVQFEFLKKRGLN
jgi:hypothetical protein